MTSMLWMLVALAVAQAAPQNPYDSPSQLAKRQQSVDVIITETRVEVFSETLTETLIETFTATEPAPSPSGATTIISPITSLPVQRVHFEADVPDADPGAQGVLFLPGDQNSPSADSPAPSPSQTDSNATNGTAAGSTLSNGAGPANAAQTPSVRGPIVSAYYPDWVTSDLPPENIDMSRLDWIDFAFATLDENLNLNFDDPDNSPDVLRRLVSAAHDKGTKVKLSIGGWSGSRYFSSACADPSTRQTFVNNAVNIYNQFQIDGIDIDWEYPGQQGEGDNTVSPDDSANFLEMLKLLRSSLPRGARITAAVQDVTFAGPDGSPLNDVSAFAEVLDWVNIMNYDVWGSSSNPGPNAPLSNGCQDSAQPDNNAETAISAWTRANFPASKLMLGVPFYGYLNPSDATQLQHRKRSFAAKQGLTHRQVPSDAQNALNPILSVLPVRTVSVNPVPSPIAKANVTSILGNGTANIPLGIAVKGQASAQGPAGTVTLKSGDGTTNSGQLQFNSLLTQGALLPVRVVKDGGPADQTTFVSIGGFTRFWDDCSSTPFLTSSYSDQVITYDDPQSLGLKAAFAKQAGILGTAVWDLSGDTPQWDLINSLRQGLGKNV